MAQILWFGPASAQMMAHLPAVRLEVLAQEGEFLRVKVLDQPQAEEGSEPMLCQGEELRIANRYASNGQRHNLLDFLKTRYVAPWYRSKVEGEKGGIAGAMYSRDPSVKQ